MDILLYEREIESLWLCQSYGLKDSRNTTVVVGGRPEGKLCCRGSDNYARNCC